MIASFEINRTHSDARDTCTFLLSFLYLFVALSLDYNGTKNTAVSLEFIPFYISYPFVPKYRGVIMFLFVDISNLARIFQISLIFIISTVYRCTFCSRRFFS